MKIRLGILKNELAAIQAYAVAANLRAVHPELEVKEVFLKGSDPAAGDLQRALLAEEIDLAVQAYSALPTALISGLKIAAVPERESPWDSFVSKHYADLVDLPPGSKVATAALRCAAQIKHRFPHIEVVEVAGGVDQCLQDYQQHGAQALVTSAADLIAIGQQATIRSTFGPTEMTPGPAQGALSLQVRSQDEATLDCVSVLHDKATAAAVTAECAFVHEFAEWSSLPMGALAQTNGNDLVLTGMIASIDGETLLQLSAEGEMQDPLAVAKRLAGLIRKADVAGILATEVHPPKTHGGETTAL